MNLILAISSFFSAVLLPGAILYRIFIKETLVISTFIVYSFIFSLCFNFLLIYILILSGIYNQNIVIFIMAIEWIAFIYLFRNEIKYGIAVPQILNSNNNEVKILFALGVLICLFMLNNVFKVDIFYAWDAVVSWNRWATELAEGKFVLNEGGYPQLYPMLLSLGYVASAKISSFQGIGVAIWNYFAFVGIVCSAFLLIQDSKQDLKNTTQWSIFGLITSIVAYIVLFVLSNQFYIGYVDMPVAIMILISALLIIKSSINIDDKNKAYLYLIISAFAAGISSEIKQAGLFYVAIYIICLFYLWYKYKLSNKILLACLAIIVIFVAPWVIIAIYKKIALNMQATNASYTMSGIYGDVTPLERLLSAIKTYKTYFILFVVGLCAIKSQNKILGIFGVFGFLYFIFWGCFLSYDLRNLQAGIPLMIIAFSYVINKLIMKTKSINLTFRFIPIFFIIFIFIGMLASFFAQENILNSEYKRKMTLGGKQISNLILQNFKDRGKKIILTDNKLIAYIPEIGNKYYKPYDFKGSLDSFNNDLKNLKIEFGKFYILLPIKELNRYNTLLINSIYLGDDGFYALIEIDRN